MSNESVEERVRRLEERVMVLEQRLQHAPGETCPGCGSPEYRATREQKVTGPLGMAGGKEVFKKCRECGYDGSDIKMPPGVKNR